MNPIVEQSQRDKIQIISKSFTDVKNNGLKLVDLNDRHIVKITDIPLTRESFEIITQDSIYDEIIKSTVNMGIVLSFDGPLNSLGQHEMNLLNLKYNKNKAMMISLESATQNQCEIWWKNSKIDRFVSLYLEIPDDDENKAFRSVIYQFLMNCLKEDHSGMKQNI